MGPSPTKNGLIGRVEVFLQGQWGTVCHNDWDLKDAQVVCTQLGCGSAISATNEAYFGQGTGLIWLDGVNCRGNETAITNCENLGFGSQNCKHVEDDDIICDAATPVRLVNGTSNNPCSGRVEILHYGQWATVCNDNWDLLDAQVVCGQLGCGRVLSAPHGRVEVFLQGQWGTVCHDDWDLNDAQLVCRQLGCGSAISAINEAYFGLGTGPIWLDDVNCGGN
ncbi:unnamed protein product [Gadus morhua 'NCC']